MYYEPMLRSKIDEASAMSRASTKREVPDGFLVDLDHVEEDDAVVQNTGGKEHTCISMWYVAEY